MPLRVGPNQVPERGKHLSILVQPTQKPNDVPIVDDLTSDQQNINGGLLKTIDEIYSPVLNLMALFGMYFGNTGLKHLHDVSGRKHKRGFLSGIYCVVVASGFWLNFIMSVVDVFLGENLYLYILFSLWTLLIALSATICLIVLCVPLGDSKKSQFENFLRNLLAINTNVDLGKAKSKAKKGIITFCFLFILGVIGVIITYKVMDVTIGDVTPWKQWFGFTILSLIFCTYGMGVWFLPILFFCITCLILEALFDDLHKRMSSFHTFLVDIGTFKKEHCRLCEIVEFSDKVLAPLLFCLVSLYIPFICFEFYKLVNPPRKQEFVFLISNIFWLVSAAGILAVIMAFGSKLSEKVDSMETILFVQQTLGSPFSFEVYTQIQNFQKILQDFPVPKEDEGKVLTAFQIVSFIQHLQGDSKGLSIGGLVVINKDTSLTIIGVIVSYFAVILSLPK